MTVVILGTRNRPGLSAGAAGTLSVSGRHVLYMGRWPS